jgi:hypothetical protein
MPPDPDQLSLFCRGCCGSGVVVVQAPNHDGNLVAVPAPCPVCRPDPRHSDTFIAVAALANRDSPRTACR